MAPIPPEPRSLPRIVLYHQTTHDPDGNIISILPLVTQPAISLTHLIVAAIHINEDPGRITLNDHVPSDARYTTLWAELRVAQASGVKVLGMLGGAARGSYNRLDRDDVTFESYYGPVRDLLRERGLDGIDLDVEEHFSLAGVIRLIDRLRSDFGPGFLITLAPVAAALLDVEKNLSGFDYEALEVMRGKDIAWYNAQFYNGWGDASNPVMYEILMAKGWMSEKVVVGLLTSRENGRGWVPWELLSINLALLKRQLGNRFGGVMGWEYFNSSPAGRSRPWEWAQQMTRLLRAESDEHVESKGGSNSATLLQQQASRSGAIGLLNSGKEMSSEGKVSKEEVPEEVTRVPQEEVVEEEVTAEKLSSAGESDPAWDSIEAPVPTTFEYHSEGLFED